MSDAAAVAPAALRARRLTLEGTYNVRDVGGYPTADGGRIRDRVLLRADSLHALTDDGQRALAALGLRTVLDLREPRERSRYPARVREVGASTVHLPLIGGGDTDRPTDPGWSLGDAYVRMLDQGERIVAAVRVLAAPAALPALVHCMAGKDRTGIVIALVLGAVGVDDELVVADFGASALFLDERYRGEAIERAVDRGVSRALAQRLVDCRPEHMAGALAEVRRRHGDPAGYLRAHGLADAELDALRRALVAPERG